MAEKFSEMADNELKEMAKDCHQAIEDDCFGTTDIRNMEGSINELILRHYTISKVSKLVITKPKRRHK